jgi:hypothetical protein
MKSSPGRYWRFSIRNTTLKQSFPCSGRLDRFWNTHADFVIGDYTLNVSSFATAGRESEPGEPQVFSAIIGTGHCSGTAARSIFHLLSKPATFRLTATQFRIDGFVPNRCHPHSKLSSRNSNYRCEQTARLCGVCVYVPDSCLALFFGWIKPLKTGPDLVSRISITWLTTSRHEMPLSGGKYFTIKRAISSKASASC